MIRKITHCDECKVPKGWGHETIFVNNELYCGKLLVFKKGCKFSMHYHMIKDETWYINEGEFIYRWIDTALGETKETILKKDEYRQKLDRLNHVESCDFEDLIKKWDNPDTYFYLDPPYKYTDGDGTHDQDYGSKSMFGDSSHERLAKLLQNTKSRWSLSYYWFKELEEWFPRDKYRWISKEFHRPSASFSNDTKGTELLIMNYDENFNKI